MGAVISENRKSQILMADFWQIHVTEKKFKRRGDILRVTVEAELWRHICVPRNRVEEFIYLSLYRMANKAPLHSWSNTVSCTGEQYSQFVRPNVDTWFDLPRRWLKIAFVGNQFISPWTVYAGECGAFEQLRIQPEMSCNLTKSAGDYSTIFRVMHTLRWAFLDIQSRIVKFWSLGYIASSRIGGHAAGNPPLSELFSREV
jgi:hypothetical protein